ncbi:MAG: ATP-dependent Clp protease proteolytic subunit [Alphaproteobacteria bacterium]|nr:ATP-dependent Clp protease proteolytic subunit [Alphaproteobacteria bacterium]
MRSTIFVNDALNKAKSSMVFMQSMCDFPVIENEEHGTEINVAEFIGNHSHPPIVEDHPFDVKILKISDETLLVNIVISGFIESPQNWIIFEKILNRMRPTDIVRIYICSGGGCVAGGMCVIAAMAECKAEITTIGMGMIASMGSGIWMFGNKRIVLPLTVIMYHMSAGAVGGKTNFIVDYSEGLVKFMNEVFFKRALRLGIITNEEAADINTIKKDVYITSDEYNQRMGLGGLK